jgi:hypothetical protein
MVRGAGYGVDRVQPRCRFRNTGTEYVRNFGVAVDERSQHRDVATGPRTDPSVRLIAWSGRKVLGHL